MPKRNNSAKCTSNEIYYSLLKSSYFRSEFNDEELNQIQVLERRCYWEIKDLGILEETKIMQDFSW